MVSLGLKAYKTIYFMNKIVAIKIYHTPSYKMLSLIKIQLEQSIHLMHEECYLYLNFSLYFIIYQIR